MSGMETDVFYSKSNMEQIKKVYQQIADGEVIVKSMDELEAMVSEESRCKLPNVGEMFKEEFDKMLGTGLAEAQVGKSIPVDEAFDELLGTSDTDKAKMYQDLAVSAEQKNNGSVKDARKALADLRQNNNL